LDFPDAAMALAVSRFPVAPTNSTGTPCRIANDGVCARPSVLDGCGATTGATMVVLVLNFV